MTDNTDTTTTDGVDAADYDVDDGNSDDHDDDGEPVDAPFNAETDAALGDRAVDAAGDVQERAGDVRERAEAAGEMFANGVNTLRVGASKVWTGFLFGATTVLGTDKVWQNRFKKNMKRMYKTTDADAIGFVVRKNGSILPTPVKYRPPEIDEDEDRDPRGHWEAGHMDQTFTAATGANATETINNVPVVWLHTDDWAESSFSGALLGEAVDVGQTEAVYQNPTVNVIELTQEATPGADGAVADGGAVSSQTRVENVTPGALKDVAVDVESVGRHDGTRVRWEKFKDLRMEQTTVEEMNQTQERGRLAGLREAMDGENTSLYKWAFLAIVVAALGGVYLGANISGGGGGGGDGGGMMPLMMTMDSMLQTLPVGVGWL